MRHDMALASESPGSGRENLSDRVDRKYLEQITRKGAWEEAQFSIVHNEARYEKFVRAFVTRSYAPSDEPDTELDIEPETNLLSIGHNFGQLAKRSDDNSECQTRFGCFQLLLWISYVAYLQFKRVSEEDINDSMSWLGKSYQRRRKQFLLQARRVNVVIRNIAHTCRWDIARATEVFFLFALPKTSLLKISEEALNSIPQQLSDANIDFQSCLTPRYCIPGLLLQLVASAGLANEQTLQEICEALGYGADFASSVDTENTYTVDAAAKPRTFSFVNFEPCTVNTSPGIRQRKRQRSRSATRDGMTTEQTISQISTPTHSFEGSTGTSTHSPMRSRAPVNTETPENSENGIDVVSSEAGASVIQSASSAPDRHSDSFGGDRNFHVSRQRNVERDVECAGGMISRAPQTNTVTHSVTGTTGTEPTGLNGSLFAEKGRPLEFLSTWLVPNTCDILHMYKWGTLEALQLMGVKEMQLMFWDNNYQYFQAPPEFVEYGKDPRYLGCSLVEAIQRSKQWKDEEQKRAEDKSILTHCLTIGLPTVDQGPYDTCIVYIIAGS